MRENLSSHTASVHALTLPHHQSSAEGIQFSTRLLQGLAIHTSFIIGRELALFLGACSLPLKVLYKT